MSISRHYIAGVTGGLVGGVVFGVIFTAMGAMPLIASIVGGSSIAVGWLVHLIVSAIAGFTFAWWFGNMAESYTSGAEYGLLNGLVWWIAGGLMLLPLFTGGTVFVDAFTGFGLLSLIGHLIYGALAGVVFVMVDKPHAALHPKEAHT